MCVLRIHLHMCTKRLFQCIQYKFKFISLNPASMPPFVIEQGKLPKTSLSNDVFSQRHLFSLIFSFMESKKV